MNNSFKKFLEEKNIFWMLVSLAIAFALWVIVINTQNPEVSKSYDVKMQVANYEMVTTAGYVVTNLDDIENERVRVTVRGPKKSIDMLGEKDINIVVDISKINFDMLPGVVPITLEYEIASTLDGLQLDSKRKTDVNVIFEKAVNETFKVEIETNGVAAQDYIMVADAITPSDIVVSGAESAIERVAGVKADVNVTDMSQDTRVLAVPYAYDITGAVVEGVNLNVSEVEVDLKAHVSKTVPVVYDIGEPAEGYVVDNVVCTPFELNVTGKPEVLDTIEEITLPHIDVTGRVSAVQQVVYLEEILPEGIRTTDNVDKIIVDIKIIASADIYVDANTSEVVLEGEKDNLSYTVKEESFKMLLAGSGEKISALGKGDYTVKVDVSDLSSGEHTVEAEVILPVGIALKGDAPVVTITVTEGN